MHTSLEAVALGARTREAAANEEFVELPPAAPAPEPHPGWDPYEVWRTRVKDVPEQHDRLTRSA